jgi:hypothetical protein
MCQYYDEGETSKAYPPGDAHAGGCVRCPAGLV